jgi:hypothetical protein
MESREMGVTIGGAIGVTIGIVRLALKNLVSIEAGFEGGYI